MPDEEKAEESYIKYRDEKCEITRNTYNHLHKDWRKSGVDRHKAYIDGYLDGIVEGRKENNSIKQILINLVTAFNNYECAGPEQEQENTWETLRDLMHEELLKIENGEISK